MKLTFLNSHSSQNHTKHSVLGVLLGWLLISALVGQLISANELQNHSKFNELNRWYEVFLSGSKVGHAHSTMILSDNEVVAESTFHMSIKRAGISINITSTERTRETLAGEIISFSGEMKMAGVPIVKNGWIEGNEIIIKEKQFLRESEKRYPLDAEGRMTWGLMKLLQEKGFKDEGIEFETKIYSADFGMASPTKAKITSLGESTIELEGKEVRAFKSEITLFTKMGKMKTINWLDQDGFAVRTKMQLGGIPIEIKQSNEFEAKKKSEDIDFDFLFQTLLFLDQEIPEDAKTVRFKVSVTRGEVSLAIHQSRNQKITRVDSKNFIVDVRAEKWGGKIPSKKNLRPVNQEYREANLIIDSEDQLIRQLSKNAAQGSKNIIELSQSLYRFARNYIHHKNFNVGFATATETARSREGDCTEHAVFLAALGRVHGIPTRVAYGLAFMKKFENKKNVMGFHMWTEFYLNGKWRLLDSALGKAGSHADRITFSVSSLKQDSLTDIALGLAEIIGNINVKVEIIEQKN
jgi:hypothetical protein